PPVTPDLDSIDDPAAPFNPGPPLEPIFPERGGQPFAWDALGVDRAGDLVSLSAPLLFVPDTWVKAQREGGETPREIGETASAAYAVGQRNVLDARGQQVSFAPPVAHGDTRLEVNTLTWAGHIDTTALTSRPFLQSS